MYKDDRRYLYRRSDPDTSMEAAMSVKLTKSRALVLCYARELKEFTDEELVGCIIQSGEKISRSGIRTRRAELARGGYVIDTGRIKRTESGRKAIVWAAITGAQGTLF